MGVAISVWTGAIATGRLELSASERSQRQAYIRSLPDGPVELVIRRRKSQRSSSQNRRYWALMTVGAESLGWDEPESLHQELAHLLLPLPPCLITGLRKRKRTPKLNTAEFSYYMDAVARTLIDLGADLSAWDEELTRQEQTA